MAALLPPSPDPHNPHSLSKWYFPERSKCPQWQKKKRQEGISSAHSSAHCQGKPGWLTKLVLQEVAHLPSRALSPAGLSVRLLLQTPRQAPLAGTELPWAGAGALMVKGRARGHSKSFTNISQSFIIFALPTAAHKSTKVHELCPPQRSPGLTPRFRAPRALRARMGFRGRGMPGLGWGFWIPDCRLEVFKFF